MTKQHLNVGDHINLQIKRMGINGEGIGYDQKLAIFVENAIPGEVCEVMITDVFHNRALGKVVSIKKESDDRAKPFCPVYESCGGCQLQHLSYQRTLIEKRQLIVQAFERYLPFRIPQDRIKETLGMKHPTHYRNKATLPVRKTKTNKIGMYAAGGKKFVPIDECPVQDKHVNQILKTIIELMNEIGVDAYDTKYRKGFISHVIVRVSIKDEAQVTFICKKIPNRLEQLAEALMTKETMVKAVFRVLEEKGSKALFNRSLTKIKGSDVITEVLNDHTFLLEPEAFFQLNRKQADVFFQTIRNVASLTKNEVVIDAYAGSAPISHYVANDCKHVYAIEENKAAVTSAKRSLEMNQINNVTLINDSFEEGLNKLRHTKIDVMFFDPPRTGLGEDTIKVIKAFKPKRMVYGSCNPSTLAKDLSMLVDDYVIIETTPLDMFPYTAQVESVTLLELK